MNKHWQTYLLGICLVLLFSCAESDMAVEAPATVTCRREIPINFVGSYVDNAATRHSNELCSHFLSMGVWGWCTDFEEKQALVFNNQMVAYNTDSARWEYSPLQYWHEGCNYSFCAYAPHQQHTDAEVCIDSDNRMISINRVALHGYNLQDSPTETVQELFCDTPDTDWMVARAGQTVIGMEGISVEFVMQHILAKLNVCIKVDPTLLGKRRIASITADSIVVGALASQGDFAQRYIHTPIPGESQKNEWTTRDTTLYIKGTQPCLIKDTPMYLVESLVLPQQVGTEAMVVLHYSFHYGSGRTEECRYRMSLSDAFSHFEPGYDYTLTFTLSPHRIVFDAGSTNWDINAADGQTLQ